MLLPKRERTSSCFEKVAPKARSEKASCMEAHVGRESRHVAQALQLVSTPRSIFIVSSRVHGTTDATKAPKDLRSYAISRIVRQSRPRLQRDGGSRGTEDREESSPISLISTPLHAARNVASLRIATKEAARTVRAAKGWQRLAAFDD